MEARVPLTELGVSVGEAEAAGLEVGPDWMQRPSVALDAAARWFADRQAATEEHERLGRSIWPSQPSLAGSPVDGGAGGRAEARARSGAGRRASSSRPVRGRHEGRRRLRAHNPPPGLVGQRSAVALPLEYIAEGDRRGVRRPWRRAWSARRPGRHEPRAGDGVEFSDGFVVVEHVPAALARASSPPSLLDKFGDEKRTGWIQVNIAEDHARGLGGSIDDAASLVDLQRRLELMRKRWGP